MESQPQNPEFRNNPENFHPCQDTSKLVLWQIVKTQMKCQIGQHFIRVCTV